jgi:protein-disulfide isomerase/uncharacterized membrane protein
MICAWHLVDVFRLTHIFPETHRSFCNINETMNCDEVALHDEFSVVLGTPVAVWGLAGFSFVALLALVSLIRTHERFGQGLLFLFGCLFLLVSLWLIYVMHSEIGSWCIVCLAIDAVNLFLLGFSIGAILVSGKGIRQAVFDDFRRILRTPLLLFGIVVAGVGMLAGAWIYGQRLQESIAAARKSNQNAVGDLEAGGGGSKVLYLSRKDEQLETKTWSQKTGDTPQEKACADETRSREKADAAVVQVGVSPDGFNWKGAKEPILEIQEFTDFQCPHCRRAHMMVSKLVARYADRVRVYHRHLPLDEHCNPMVKRPFHPRACELSKIAVCAGQQGRFWEMDDYLFHNSPNIGKENIPAVEIAKALELDMVRFECCMKADQSMAPIDADIKAALKLKLRGTPAFVINGEVYYGRIPDEALKVLNPDTPRGL